MTARPVPRTWVAGETVGATIMNAHVRDALNAIYEDVTEAWASFTPTWTNLTVGSGGTSAGKYAYMGQTTFFYAQAVLGASGFSVGAVELNFPQTCVAYIGTHILGTVGLLDLGTAFYEGAITYKDTASVYVQAKLASGTYVALTALSSTVPHTWAAGDTIVVRGAFERA
jgi:hypothetical protein